MNLMTIETLDADYPSATDAQLGYALDELHRRPVSWTTMRVTCARQRHKEIKSIY